MQKQVINTEAAPAAIGPYSQAVKLDNCIYLSGQIGMDPATTELVAGGFAAQAQQVFKNLQAVATAAGANLNDLVKLNIYLTDLRNFAALNDLMPNYFQEPYPARATVEVAALPKAALIEIDGILQI